MKTKTNLKAGGFESQHNETLVRDAGLKLKTRIKAGKGFAKIIDISSSAK